jgi:hypothetical protein
MIEALCRRQIRPTAVLAMKATCPGVIGNSGAREEPCFARGRKQRIGCLGHTAGSNHDVEPAAHARR